MKILLRFISSILFLSLSLFHFNLAQCFATTITYKISGQISNIRDEAQVLQNTFAIGDSFEGAVSYKTEVVDYAFPSDPNDAFYMNILSFDFRVLTYEFASDIATAQSKVFNNNGASGNRDRISFSMNWQSNLEHAIDLTGYWKGAAINFIDFTGTMLNDDSMPVNIDLKDYSLSYLQFSGVNFNNDSRFAVRCNISSISKTNPTPEPSANILFYIGLIGLAGLNRKFITRT